MAVTREDVEKVLKKIRPPGQKEDLVALGLIEDIEVEDETVQVILSEDLEEEFRSEVKDAIQTKLAPLNGVSMINVNFAGGSFGEYAGDETEEYLAGEHEHGPGCGHDHSHESAEEQAPLLPEVKHIIAVGAGKGGVGKSTLAVHIAVGLARQGAKVGLLDADVYGPSVATMVGVEGRQPEVRGERVRPFESLGIKSISMANFAPPGQAMIWRGPMVHGALMQLLTQVEWGELDYLIIDLPPGTGDAPLTFAQSLSMTGAVVVSTPQPLSLNDTARAAQMYQQLGIPVLGLVENMSYFVCDQCRKEHDLFGRGGVKNVAEKLHLPLLGEVPVTVSLRANTDAGNIPATFGENSPTASAINSIVKNLLEQIRLQEQSGKPRG